MDKEAMKYWKKSRAQVRAELRNAGFDPKQLVSRVKELVNAKVHHSEAARGRHHQRRIISRKKAA